MAKECACDNCNTVNQAAAPVCYHCGVPMKKPAAQKVAKKSSGKKKTKRA